MKWWQWKSVESTSTICQRIIESIDKIPVALDILRLSIHHTSLGLLYIGKLEEIVDESLKYNRHFKYISQNLFYRRWLLADLRRIKKNIKALRKLISKPDYDITSVSEKIEMLYLHANNACGLIRLRQIRDEIKDNYDNYRISIDELSHTDIVLSYKTDKYLKKKILSRLIAFAAGSNITHSLIVYEDDKRKKLFTAEADLGGLTLKDPILGEGEIYFVFKINDKFNTKDLFHSRIAHWACKVNDIKNKKFSELKCWSACIFGAIFQFSTMLGGRSIILPNPINRARGYYCSEVIDRIFKESGVYIAERSRYDAVIGPCELLPSKYLEFKGIIYRDEDEYLLSKENIRL